MEHTLLTDTIAWIRNAGPIATMLALAVFGSYRGWFFWRREYKNLEADRDYWRAVAFENVDLGKATAKVGLSIVGRSESSV
jgi:hypothetical protein